MPQHDIEELEAEFLDIVRCSAQSSYQRRAPTATERRRLQRLRQALDANMEGDDERTLRLYSRICECLLDYTEALRAHDQAAALSSKASKQDLKRRALLAASRGWWSDIGLSPELLDDLGRYIESRVDIGSVEPGFPLTRSWMTEKGIVAAERIITGLEKAGASDDYQVMELALNG